MALTLLEAHTASPDPHGDRAYADATFIPVAGDVVGKSRTVDKPTDESRTSVVLLDDLSLSVPVTGGARYTVESFLVFEGDPDAGLNLTFTAPADSSGSWSVLAAASPTVTGGVTAVDAPLAFGEPASVAVAAEGVAVPPRGSLITGEPGSLTLQWAPRVSPSVPLTLRAGSWLLLRRMA